MNSTVSNVPERPLNDDDQPLIIVVMGVSGCGKSTIAHLIAKGIKAHYRDGDQLHPASNIKKMEAGIALNDDDRQPWLEDVAAYARQKASEHGICVIACSALKRRYRVTLNSAGHVVYVYLQGDHDLISARMHARTGHFMPEALLATQFAALEDPRDEPNVITVDIYPEPDVVATNAIALLEDNNFLDNYL